MIQIETKRTLLRRVKISDLNSLKLILMDEKVMAFTGFRRAQTEDESIELIKKWKNDPGVWVLITRDLEELIGWFMLKNTISNDYPEIGFMLNQLFWNQGYATEIGMELMKYAFNDLRASKVIACVDLDNMASIKVLEKLGMKRSKNFPSKENLIYYEKSLPSLID